MSRDGPSYEKLEGYDPSEVSPLQASSGRAEPQSPRSPAHGLLQHKMRYYHRLQQAHRSAHGASSTMNFTPPDHVIRPYLPSSRAPLAAAGRRSRSSLMTPASSLVPVLWSLFAVFGLSDAEAGGAQSDAATVLSMANTMMGSTLLALPWGFYQSGIVLGAG